MYKFEMNRPDDRVEYEIWLSSADTEGIEFIDQFQPYDALFGDDVLMTPRYYTWSCPGCSEDLVTTNCVNEGEYCGMHQDLSTSGRDVIDENLRQTCVY